MPFTKKLGSSSNRRAIRQRLLWATEDSDYPRVTGGIFSISAPVPPWLALLQREMAHGRDIGSWDWLDLAGVLAHTC